MDYIDFDVDSETLKDFKGLIGLSVGCCKITNKEAELIASKLPNLIYLDISFNEIGDNGITKISKGLKYLSFLDIGYNEILNNGFQQLQVILII